MNEQDERKLELIESALTIGTLAAQSDQILFDGIRQGQQRRRGQQKLIEEIEDDNFMRGDGLRKMNARNASNEQKAIFHILGTTQS